MPEFRTASLGNVLQTAEAIKGMRRQAETDKLRDAYLGVQTQNAQQAGQINASQETRAQESHKSEQDMTKARYRYLLAERAEAEPDQVGFIRQFAPDLIKDFDEAHGQGAFEQLPPEQRTQILGQIKAHASAVAGIQPKVDDRSFTLSEGQTRFGPDGKPLASVAPKPTKAPARFRPMSPQEIAASGLPPGTAAQVNDDSGQIQVLSKRDASSTLSQKDATTAKIKLQTVTLARQQLHDIRKAFSGIKDTMQAGGGGQGMVPTVGGQSFDRAVDQMRSTLTALVRVPGVGAMSDYETKLDQAKFPSRRDYEAVTEQQIAAIDQQLQIIESGYNTLLGGSQPTEQQQEPDLSSVSDEDLLRQLNGG